MSGEEEPRQYPVFVYGTLRPGADRYAIVRSYVAEGGTYPATVDGYQMYKVSNFAGAVEEDGDVPVLHGDILVIKPEEYEEAIERLDRYEAEGFLFRRVLVRAKLKSYLFNKSAPVDTVTTCWFYELVREVSVVERVNRIAQNDWFARG